MRLDWECVRAILVATEALDDETEMFAPGTLPGVGEAKAVRHIQLLVEAGLIEGYPPGRDAMFAQRLTWEGHQFLATLRSKDLWERVKTVAKDRGLALSFEVVRSLATKFINNQL